MIFQVEYIKSLKKEELLKRRCNLLYLLIIIFLYVFKIRLKFKFIKAVIISFIVAYSAMFIFSVFLDNVTSILKIILVSLVVIYLYLRTRQKQHYNKLLKEWKLKKFKNLSVFEFINDLNERIDTSAIRYVDNIPYNRLRCFSGESEYSLENEGCYPIFYHAKPADNEMKFEEYGYLVTTAEIIIKSQHKTKDKEISMIRMSIPFENIYSVSKKEKSVFIFYANQKTLEINNFESLDQLELIYQIVQNVITLGWSKNIKREFDKLNEIDLETEDMIIEVNKKLNDLTNEFNVEQQNEHITRSNEAANLSSVRAELFGNQINDRFGGGQGHGHVGEQFGNVKDRLLGKNAIGKGNDHSKNGADRIVNNVNIQTKFCATAGKSIYQAFNNEGAKYLNANGTMMKIEVPKDQYLEAIKHMENQISKGCVPLESDPLNAVKYVKKGAITYEQAQIATKSIFDRGSTIKVRDSSGKVIRDGNGNTVIRDVTFGEKMLYSAGGDFLTGVTAAVPIATITSVWIYCNNRWHGISSEEAMKNALIGGLKPILASATIYMVSSQFAGSKIGANIGAQVAGSKLVKHIPGKLVGKARLAGTTANILTATIIIGPDIIDSLNGRISMNQLLKNTLIHGTGVLGGITVGASIGSVFPGVGNIVGGIVGGIGSAIASTGAKKVLDEFMEDDAKKMIQFAKEEFIETVLMSGVTKNEFDDIISHTFLHKKFAKILKDMYASREPEKYISELYREKVVEVYKKRELPNENELMNMLRLRS
ncbi:hypothetical protein BFR40_05820 [Brochothrix thermosphacta]|nr:hypothetical protein BFR40_05820 [Brochothrix thermosphacta]